MGSGRTDRHFTVAVFVAWEGKVLLHWHRKLGMWLPPGGHRRPRAAAPTGRGAAREHRARAPAHRPDLLRKAFGLNGDPGSLLRRQGRLVRSRRLGGHARQRRGHGLVRAGAGGGRRAVGGGSRTAPYASRRLKFALTSGHSSSTML